MKISLLLPTRERTDWLERVFNSVEKTMSGDNLIQFSLWIDNDDNETIEYIEDNKNKFSFKIKPFINKRLKHTGKMWDWLWLNTDADVYGMLGDDTEFKTNNWDKMLVNKINEFDDRIVFLFPEGSERIHDKEEWECIYDTAPEHYFITDEACETLGRFCWEYSPLYWNETWIEGVFHHLYEIYKKKRIFRLPFEIEHIRVDDGKAKPDKVWKENREWKDDNIPEVFKSKISKRKEEARKLYNKIEGKEEDIASIVDNNDYKLSITYYRIKKNTATSFVSNVYIENLKELGYNVDVKDIENYKITEIGNGKIGIIQPVFIIWQKDKEMIKKLRKNHDFLIGMDVLDTTDIGSEYKNMIDIFDKFIVPTEFTKGVLEGKEPDDGITVINHGVRTDKINKSNENILSKYNINEKFNILLYGWERERKRKNTRLIYEVLHDLKDEYNFNIVTKTKHNPPRNTNTKKGRKVSKWLTNQSDKIIYGWVDESEMYNIYKSMDLYVAPVMCGGWELTVLEALACGLPTITSNFPNIVEYASPYASICDSIGEEKNPISINMWSKIHTGSGVKVDKENLKDLIRYNIENKDITKKYFSRISKAIREQYSWKSSAKKLDNILRFL